MMTAAFLLRRKRVVIVVEEDVDDDSDAAVEVKSMDIITITTLVIVIVLFNEFVTEIDELWRIFSLAIVAVGEQRLGTTDEEDEDDEEEDEDEDVADDVNAIGTKERCFSCEQVPALLSLLAFL